MVYVISILTSVVSAMLVFILQSSIKENRRLKQEAEKARLEKEVKQEQENNALKEGVLCLLRAKMVEYHTKYMGLGYITSHAYENWTLMYKAYKALGGNGMIEHMNEEIEELHIEKH